MLIGFAPQSRSVTVADQPITLDFSLTAQTVQLEAVVTVGYGTAAPSGRHRRRLVGQRHRRSRRRHAERRADARGPRRRRSGHAEQRRAGWRSLDPRSRRQLHRGELRAAVRDRRHPRDHRHVVERSLPEPALVDQPERHREHRGPEGRVVDGDLRRARRGRRGAHHHQARPARPEPRHASMRRWETRRRRRRSRC